MDSAGGPIRVLYVDDTDTAGSARTALESADIDVEVAATAADALDRVDGATDCVLSEYDLPDRTGIDLLRAVREDYPTLPFVLFTAAGSEAVASEAVRAGVTDYVRKRDREALPERVAEAVASARSGASDRALEARALDEAPIGITITGPREDDAPMQYVNDEFERLTGYDEAELLGRNCRLLQGEDTDEEAVAVLREAIAEAESASVRLRNYREDGTEFWNRVSIAPVRDEDGTVTNYVGFQQDVSEDLERERILETLHTAAADIQQCQSITAACERTVEAASSILDLEVCSLLLAEDGHLDPVALSEDAPPDGVRRVPDDHGLAGKTFQSGESHLVEEVTPDDDTDPAKASYRSGISVPVGDHGVFQAVSTVPGSFDDTDVTSAELLVAHTALTINRLENEQRLRDRGETLRRQNKRLERLAGFVSHDLRNPLNVAAGQLALAREECDSDRLDGVARAHARMEDLIERLLTIAREDGRVEEPEPVALSAVVEESWENVATAEATLRTRTERTIQADPGRLQQLFENLVRNAIEHGGPGVTVTVGDLPTGFYIADDGPGITPDERESVFEYGYSNRSEGTGFGLAIVREIAEAHGWSVSVTEAETGGARFEFVGVESV